MNYKDYQNARDAVWKLLIDTGANELPIKVTQICQMLDIQVKLYTPEDESDGASLMLNGKPVIFVSDKATPARQRFTAAHELGHILLGHVGQYEQAHREPGPKNDPIEQAANVFASRLLAPACVLWGCGAKTPEDIAKLCNISYQAAVFRAAQMWALYRRDKFLTSPLERMVYEQFTDYIAAHKL